VEVVDEAVGVGDYEFGPDLELDGTLGRGLEEGFVGFLAFGLLGDF